MLCSRCRKEVKSGVFCDTCFVIVLEKRVKKSIREEDLFRKNDKVLIIDDSSPEARTGAYMLPRLLRGLPITIDSKKGVFTHGKKFPGKSSKVVVPWNADHEAEIFLESVFENKENRFQGNYSLGEKRYIKLFLPCLSSEVRRYAKIKGIKSISTKRESAVSGFLDKLESEYPEVKFSVLNASAQLKGHGKDKPEQNKKSK